MISVTLEFEDEEEARDALNWKAVYGILSDHLETLRKTLKYEDAAPAVYEYVDKLRTGLIADCNDSNVRIW